MRGRQPAAGFGVRAAVAILLGGSLLLWGCNTAPALRTTQVTGAVPSPVAGGVTYYLPKRVMKLGIWEVAEYAVADGGRGERKLTEKRKFATFMELQTIPDRNYLMRLTYEPNAAFHDYIEVHMSREGLLAEVKTTIRDEGPAIVAKLAELASGIAHVGSGPRAKSVGATEQFETYQIGTMIVDPTDPSSYESQLGAHGITMTALPTLAGADACCTLEPNQPCESICTQSGVCYRPVIPFRVTLKPGGRIFPTREGEVGVELREGIEDVFMFPNRSPVVCLAIDRVPFVTSTFRVTFEHGLLTSMASDKPSEILAFLEIPITVAKAIVSIPAELLQFRIHHYEQVNKAAASEQAAFKAIEDLSKAKQAGGN